jgi:two-component sensor histidine kinase
VTERLVEVANSLALVTSLVRLQANTVTDASARSALQEMQARIMAVAGIHRRLYTSSDARAVELGSYLMSMVDELSTADVADKKTCWCCRPTPMCACPRTRRCRSA